jgi:hypothetical protein
MAKRKKKKQKHIKRKSSNSKGRSKTAKKAAIRGKKKRKRPTAKKKSKIKPKKKKNLKKKKHITKKTHAPVIWGSEVNAYINFVLYIISGHVDSANALMRDYRQDILRTAARLQKLRPVAIKQIYHGYLMQGHPDDIVHNSEFVSFTENKNIACWFADPHSAVNLSKRSPYAKGWVVTHTPKPEDILFHWSWGLRFPWENKELGLAAFARRHPVFATEDFNKIFKNLKEVTLLPLNMDFQAVEYEKAGCPPTPDVHKSFNQRRKRRNPVYQRRHFQRQRQRQRPR